MTQHWISSGSARNRTSELTRRRGDYIQPSIQSIKLRNTRPVPTICSTTLWIPFLPRSMRGFDKPFDARAIEIRRFAKLNVLVNLAAAFE
jgi:hypothetical protein